jgi:20S proteasome subunit alpha 7
MGRIINATRACASRHTRVAHNPALLPAMTSIGTGYDLSASTYSPDGRIFQVRSAHACGRARVAAHDAPRSSMRTRPSRTRGARDGGTLAAPKCTHDILRTAIGLRVKDGVVLAVEKIVHSKLLIPEANRRIQIVDRHIGMVRAACVRS